MKYRIIWNEQHRSYLVYSWQDGDFKGAVGYIIAKFTQEEFDKFMDIYIMQRDFHNESK